MGLTKRNRRATRRHPRRRRPPRPESSDSDTFMSTLFSSSSDGSLSDDLCDDDDDDDDRRQGDRATPKGAKRVGKENRHGRATGPIDVVPPPPPASIHCADAHVNVAECAAPPPPQPSAPPYHQPEVVVRDNDARAEAPHMPQVAPSAAAAAFGATIPTHLVVPASVCMGSMHATAAFAPLPHGGPMSLPAVPPAPLPLPPGPRPAFTILRQATPAAAREYATLPTVRPWRELARAVDPTGRMALDTHAVWCGDAEGTLALPARFDGRRRWGRLLTPPSDQGLSGACWAYAAVSALGDRAALWTHGATRPWHDGIPRTRVFGSLSARDLIDRDFDALTDAQSEGEAAVVVANQVHHGTQHADYGHTLAGAFEALYVDGVRCRGGWRCRPLAYYGLATASQVDLKSEIFAWGPVASAFALYEDFMYPTRHPSSWIGGVYRHDPDACRRVFGGHAVVLVGWCEAWLPDRHRQPSANALVAFGHDHKHRHRHHPQPYTSLHEPLVQQHTPGAFAYLSETGQIHSPMRKHTCWIVRHAWGPTWSGAAAHADGHFIMVADQCHMEANVVACVPDIHGMSLDPRDAHRVAPPSAAARARRAVSRFDPSADLLGPDRIDSERLPDMSAFVAGEVYAPDDNNTGVHHDTGTEYTDGLRPPSDAWTTALRRAWASLERDHSRAVSKEARDDGRSDDPSSSVTFVRGLHALSSHVPADVHYCLDGTMPFGMEVHSAHGPHLAWAHRDDNAPFASGVPHARDHVGDGVGDQHKGSICHSNSDAEFSDDERRLDTQHRLLSRGRRKRSQPRAWSDASQHQDAW
nr:Papain-like cysteine peptidase [Pandoravirus aubagnensis]